MGWDRYFSDDTAGNVTGGAAIGAAGGAAVGAAGAGAGAVPGAIAGAIGGTVGGLGRSVKWGNVASDVGSTASNAWHSIFGGGGEDPNSPEAQARARENAAAVKALQSGGSMGGMFGNFNPTAAYAAFQAAKGLPPPGGGSMNPMFGNYNPTGASQGAAGATPAAPSPNAQAQSGLIAALQAQAAGQGTSPAQLQMQQGMQAQLQAEQAQAASARGGVNPALMQRSLADQAASGMQANNTQMGILRAGEQNSALAALGNVTGTARGQDIQSTTAAGQLGLGYSQLAGNTAYQQGMLANGANQTTNQNNQAGATLAQGYVGAGVGAVGSGLASWVQSHPGQPIPTGVDPGMSGVGGNVSDEDAQAAFAQGTDPFTGNSVDYGS